MKSRVWKYGDNINTDVIFPGKYTYTLSEPAELAEPEVITVPPPPIIDSNESEPIDYAQPIMVPVVFVLTHAAQVRD